ncbi:hypothetical protein JHK85_028519 [Glycine max]|nr:hypothetical protein JHK85_028519 [Glycine max]
MASMLPNHGTGFLLNVILFMEKIFHSTTGLEAIEMPIIAIVGILTCGLLLELHIDDNHLSNLALLEIEQLLHVNQKSLKDYPSIPYPEDVDCTSYLDNSLILAELNYNNDETISEFLQLFSSMID